MRTPYRDPALARSEPDAAPRDAFLSLGAERRRYTPRPVWQTMMTPLLVAGLLMLVPVALFPAVGVASLLLIPLGAVSLVVLAWLTVRRCATIILHAEGLMVEHRRRPPRAVLFDDVDELRWDLFFTGGGRRARIVALRLREHGGRCTVVPLEVVDDADLVDRVTRRCTDPLVADAEHALRQGETLRFGRVALHRDAVSFGRRTVPWGELRLVRLLSGRVCFFRRQTVFPWRTATLDDVPHPKLFVRLVRMLARKVEIDDPFGG